MRLLERDEVLAELSDRVDAARNGHGSIVALGGEAGIGKTAVVAALRDRLDRARFLLGRCDSLATPRPLGPLLDIARDRTSGLGRIATEDARRPHELFEALLDELGSTLRPTVVVIEDAHWADEATLDLIRFVGRRIGSTHGVMVLTYRDDEVGPSHPLRIVLGDLATARGFRHFSLPPLSVEAVAVLAEGTGVDPEALYRITDGNPFFVTEVLAAGLDTLPRTVADAVLARATRLGPEARRLVDAVSIVPDRAPTWLVERLVDVTEGARDEAVDRGLLVPYAEGLHFRHDLARRAVQSALPADVRVGLHRLAIEALQDPSTGEPDSSQLAHHAERAGDEPRLVRWGSVAAEAALASGSHAEAFAHDERILRVATLAGAERAAVLERFGATARDLDRAPEGVTALEEAAAIWREEGDREGEARVLAALASMRWLAGSGTEAIATIERALDLVGGSPAGPAAAQAHVVASYLAMLNRRTDDAIAHGLEAVELGERIGEPSVVILGLNAMGSAKITAGLPGGTADLLASADIAERVGDLALRERAISNLGTALGEARRYAGAVPHLEESIRLGARHDLDLGVDYGTAWLSRIHFEQGRWGPAVLMANRSMRRRSASPLILVVALTVLGRVAARRGEQGSLDPLERARRMADETGDLQRTWPVAAGLAELAWLRGQVDRIPDIVGDLFAESVELGVPWAKGELALWLWRAGALAEPPSGCPEPVTLQIGGDWRSAAAAWSALGCPYEEGEALSDGDDEACLRAVEIFDGLGARPAARRVRQRLRARGVRAPRGPRRATEAHPAGLTPRQADVLSLLAEGLSNADIAERLYISEKTAAHHVSAILGRMEVSSRGEAVAAAHRLGLLEGDEGPGDGRG